jgi:hypothetical protein
VLRRRSHWRREERDLFITIAITRCCCHAPPSSSKKRGDLKREERDFHHHHHHLLSSLFSVAARVVANMSRAKSSQGNDGSSKKRKSDLPSFFAGNQDKDEVCFDSMSKKYVGKRILLMTADIYSWGRVPLDKENMLFQ